MVKQSSDVGSLNIFFFINKGLNEAEMVFRT